jgi:hypothetical protein
LSSTGDSKSSTRDSKSSIFFFAARAIKINGQSIELPARPGLTRQIFHP